MNINTLNQQMFFRSFNIFNDNLLNFFGNYYLKNSSHKYELYHNYVFRTDHFLRDITNFVNDEKDLNDHNFSKFYLSKDNKNYYLKNGYGRQEVTINDELDSHNLVQILHVYSNVDPKKKVKVIGNNLINLYKEYLSNDIEIKLTKNNTKI